MLFADLTVSVESTTPYESEEEKSANQHNSVESVVDLLFKKQPEPILPLWELQLEMVLPEKLDGEEKNCANQISSSPQVSLHPSKESFLSAFSKLLKQYEIVIASFKSLLKDASLRPYISRSKYDFLMVLEEQSEHTKDRVKVWPDTSALLHSYAPYSQAIDFLKMALQQTMNKIEQQSNVSVYIAWKMIVVCC